MCKKRGLVIGIEVHCHFDYTWWNTYTRSVSRVFRRDSDDKAAVTCTVASFEESLIRISQNKLLDVQANPLNGSMDIGSTKPSFFRIWLYENLLAEICHFPIRQGGRWRDAWITHSRNPSECKFIPSDSSFSYLMLSGGVPAAVVLRRRQRDCPPAEHTLALQCNVNHGPCVNEPSEFDIGHEQFEKPKCNFVALKPRKNTKVTFNSSLLLYLLTDTNKSL